MKLAIVVTVIILLPFYVYILSKSATLGKINVYNKIMKKLSKEAQDDSENSKKEE